MIPYSKVVLCLIVCGGLMLIGPNSIPSALGASAQPSLKKVIPLDLANPLDITKLTLDQYRRVASAAREAMKLVEGDMSGEETKAFQQKWAIMADFPTPQAIDYLNKLNPLLVEFLKLRGLVYTTSEEFDAAWAEGTLAAGYENASGAEEAFAIAAQQKNLLQSIQARLSTVTKQIEALGDPPDQAEAKKKAGKKHDDALKTTRKIIKAGKGKKTVPPLNRSGVVKITPSVDVIEGLSSVEFTAEIPPNIAANTTLYAWSGGHVTGDERYTKEPRITLFFRHDVGGEWSSNPGTTDIYVEAQKVKGYSLGAGHLYVPIRRLTFPDIKPPAPFTGETYSDPATKTRQAFNMKMSVPEEFPKKGTTRVRITGYANTALRMESIKPEQHKQKTEVIKRQYADNSFKGKTFRKTYSLDMGKFKGEVYEITFVNPRYDDLGNTPYGHGWRTFGYAILPFVTANPQEKERNLEYVTLEYQVIVQCDNPYEEGGDYSGLVDKKAQDLLTKITDTLNTFKVVPMGEPVAADDSDPEEEPQNPEVIKETIAFHESNIAILEKNLSREQADLGTEKDAKRREAFEFRVLTIKADIQAEKDLIASLKTGEIVHTRTEFDDYTQSQFIANIRANQIRMEVAQRQAAEAYRIAALLPPGEAETAKKFIERQLTPELIAKADLSKIQQVNGALITKVQGYVQQAQANKEIDSAEKTLMVLGGLQQAGNIAITFVGGQTGAAAYAGFTGYITGGPAEAIRGAASWYNTASYMAVEAYDGYTKGGYFAGKGLTGAIEKSAEALAIGKLFEYGIQKIGVTTGVLSKPASQAELRQRLEAFKKNEALRTRLQDFRQAEALRQGLPPFDTGQFKKDMARGKELVDEFTHIEQRLTAAKQFSAAPETVRELEALANQKAKELNASFHAKNFLKSTGGEVEKLATTKIEQLYKQVDARFKKTMSDEKWDMRYLKFKEFRNASSRGKIGMDRDFGLVEDEVTLLIKNGKTSSIHQMQKDGQKAYKQAYEEIMGQSYEKSFQEFTTRAHSESFLDVKVLNDLRNPKNVAQLERMWGEQTARTIEFKGQHMLNDPKLAPHMTLLDRHLEASRGMAKEIDKKIIPFLQNAKAAPGIDLKKIKETEEHFRGIKQILDDFSTNKIDPLAASEKLRAYTGGKDLPQILDQMRNVTETLFKFGALGK
jgi:hypothetical protein